MAKEHSSFYQHDDPWDLPSFFFLRKNKWKSLHTYSGYWKEKEEELTAIRSAGESSSSSATPSYVGVRKTLEFYLKDGTRGGEGTKTDWIIHEYHHLRKDDSGPSLFLEEDVVLRKVFKKCKNKTDHASSLHRQIESFVTSYRERKEVHCSRHDNYGNKTDIILRTEGEGAGCQDRRNNYGNKKVLIVGTWGAECQERSCSPAQELAKHYLLSFEYQLDRPRSSVQDLMTKFFVDQLINQTQTSNERMVKITSEQLNEALGVDCDPDGKSDNVWKHFTKIRSANDPDEVYAACHRCDKVLKAHPKKHGTSHLKRHIHTCSSCTNPSTDEDREMLRRLRTALNDPYEQQKTEKLDCQEDLTQQDPWDLNLTPWYVTRSLNRQTQGGHWKEINKEFTAIRMDQKVCWKDIDKEIAVMQMDHQLQVQVPQPPQYMGLKRTLHFHHQDGRMTDWIMHEYQQLDDMEFPTLLLQGCIVIRKVFRYDKDVVSSVLSDLERKLNADDGDTEYFNGDGVNTDITTTPSDCMDSPCSVFPLGEVVSSDTATPSYDSMDTPVDRKRKRTSAASSCKSEVWMHFTKIYNTDYGVAYVVCHTCDRGYVSGRSTNGTSHLWRHNKSCTNKHRRTGNANDATAEWEVEIRPLFLLLKKYGEHQPSGVMC